MDPSPDTEMNGVLIYAFNNNSVDYFAQANWCAARVTRFLALPVTIVTDEKSQAGRACEHHIIWQTAEQGGTRIYNPSKDTMSVDWYNANRYASLELTPYDRTLVLDSDYIVNSDVLLTLFRSDIEVTAMKHVYDVTGRDQFRNYRRIDPHRGLHHYWATVLYFRRGTMAQDFFDLMTMIRRHYRHYANIYGFPIKPFRNDFAVSIALNSVYGHVPDAVPEMPWSMASAFSDVEICQPADDRFELTYQVKNSLRRCEVSGQDLHCLNKQSLAKFYED